MNTKQRILELVSTGSTLRLASGACGLEPAEAAELLRTDERFRRAVRAARYSVLAAAAAKVAASKDSRSARWMLEVAPESRDEYRQESAGGRLEVVINIDRGGTGGVEPLVIEQPARERIGHDDDQR
ncbi:MAG TPA: hypothetical protein VF329_04270 [Gammaproteobacteria bacterium]